MRSAVLGLSVILACAQVAAETFDGGSNISGLNLGLDNPTITYGLFDDGFESGDTPAWSDTVP